MILTKIVGWSYEKCVKPFNLKNKQEAYRLAQDFEKWLNSPTYKAIKENK